MNKNKCVMTITERTIMQTQTKIKAKKILVGEVQEVHVNISKQIHCMRCKLYWSIIITYVHT